MTLHGTVRFPRSRQRNNFACGARCVHAILKYYDFEKPYKLLEQELGTNSEDGTTVKAIQETLARRALATPAYTDITLRRLTKHFSKGVAILHVDGDHFIVAHARRKNWIYVMDPLGLPDRINVRTLRKRWSGWAILVSE